MEKDSEYWQKRFEEADSSRRELAATLNAIRSGQVDSIRASKGNSNILRLLDAKLVEENDKLLSQLKGQSEELHQANKALVEKKKALEASKLRLEVLLNSAGEGVLGIDLVGNINFANPKTCRILEVTHKEILQRKIQSFFALQHEDIHALNSMAKEYDKSPKMLIRHWHKYQIMRLLNQELAGDEQQRYWIADNAEKIYVQFTCNPTLDSNEQCVGAVIMFQNISERKQLEDKLLHLANFDPLTGLASRSHFQLSLKQALERQKRTEKTLAVLYLDMDNFKYINDSLGHGAGDELLVKAAEILRSTIRAGDLLARLGGDEFALVLYDINASSDASRVAEKIINTFSEALALDSIQINISFSIGVALLSDELASVEDLVKAADTAMYVAKNEGRNNFKHYSLTMQEKTEQKHRIQTLLQRAIKDGEFSLVYQPKISIITKRMTGCEALLRWQPANQQAIAPAVFIPNAEESGRINEIGEWVFHTACQQVGQWLSMPGFEGLTVSINVSARQLGRKTFLPLVQAALAKNNIPAKAIEIEITETGVMENIDLVIDELQKIHDLGIKIAIDDFGTGNSSLELLRKLPLDILKIDQTFVQDIGEDKQDEEIIRVMLAVAKTLKLEVVAEGAETLEQILFLSKANCELIQGYYFSCPVSQHQFTKLISDGPGAFFNQFSDYDKAILDRQTRIKNDVPNKGQQKESDFRVLVCEDDPSIGHVIEQILGKNNFVIDIALSVTEGLSMLEKRHYNGMTLDLKFGDNNGLDFLKEVRKSHSYIQLPAIVVSAHAHDNKYAEEYRQLGICAWLSKPVNASSLLKHFRQIVADKQLAGLPKILHVEDQENQRFLVRMILKNVAQVVGATDLAQAREALIFGEYDLVLLDLGLPDGNGSELLDSIEQLKAPPAVYILSADKDEKLIKQVDGMLDKSGATFVQLNNVIMEALQKRLGTLTGRRLS